MSARRPDETSAMEKLGTRVRQRAMSGTEASTVGFLLAIYIFAGAGLGYLADGFFETNWMVAVGVLGGAALGFREMLRLIKKVTRVEVQASEEREREERAEAAAARAEYSALREASQEEQPGEPKIETESARVKPRYFEVPEPPKSSFENEMKKPR